MDRSQPPISAAMLRLEPNAELRCDESTRPDRLHPGISFVERAYFLAPGTGPDVELSPGHGEAVAAGRGRGPQPMGFTHDRFWWAFGDCIYSTPARLSRAEVSRLAQREASERAPRAYRAAPRAGRGSRLFT